MAISASNSERGSESSPRLDLCSSNVPTNTRPTPRTTITLNDWQLSVLDELGVNHTALFNAEAYTTARRELVDYFADRPNVHVIDEGEAIALLGALEIPADAVMYGPGPYYYGGYLDQPSGSYALSKVQFQVV